MNHYVVVREPRRTLVLDYGRKTDAALDEYGRLERHGFDCVLLGSDSVATLRVTHGSWFGDRVEVVAA